MPTAYDYFGDGGAGMSGTSDVNVISANHTVVPDGGVLDFSGTAVVAVHYNDRQCTRAGKLVQFGCKITFPNKHKQCFQANFITPPKRNIFPQSFGSTGAYLPAITACIQYLYIPPQTEQDVRKGPYQPPR